MVKKLDVRGRACPVPIVELMREIRDLRAGDTIEITADDRAFPADVAAWCRKTQHELITLEPIGESHVAVVRKVAR
jgi:tRNA 2-thiouridine synthesizing protein A